MSTEDIVIGLLIFCIIIVCLIKMWFDHTEFMKKQELSGMDNISTDFGIKCSKLEDDIAILKFKVLDMLEDIQYKLEEDKHIEYDDITQFVDGITAVQVKPSRYVELLSYEAELFDLKLKLKEATKDDED